MDQNSNRGIRQVNDANAFDGKRTLLGYLASDRIIKHMSNIRHQNIEEQIAQLPIPNSVKSEIKYVRQDGFKDDRMLRDKLVEQYGKDSDTIKVFDIVGKGYPTQQDVNLLNKIIVHLGGKIITDEEMESSMILLEERQCIHPIGLIVILREKGMLDKLGLDLDMLVGRAALCKSRREIGVAPENHDVVKHIIDEDCAGFNYVVDWINNSSQMIIESPQFRRAQIPAMLYFQNHPKLISKELMDTSIKALHREESMNHCLSRCILMEPTIRKDFFQLLLKKPGLSVRDKQRIENAMKSKKLMMTRF